MTFAICGVVNFMCALVNFHLYFNGDGTAFAFVGAAGILVSALSFVKARTV